MHTTDTSSLNRLATRLTAPLALACLAFGATGARAQDAPPAEPAADQTEPAAPVVSSRADYFALDRKARRKYAMANRPPVSFITEGGGSYHGPADLDDHTGDVAVSRLRGGGGLSFRLSDETNLLLRGGAEFSFYDFSDATGLIPTAPGVDEPFDDVYEVDFSPMLRVSPREGWRWFIGGSVASSGEPGADFEDTITGGGLAGASYDVTDDLRLGVGVSVTTRLEGGVFVFPIPIINWQITEDLELGTRERGLSLGYWFRDNWNVALSVGFDRREYRLADDNAALPGGSVTDRRIPLTVDLTYSTGPGLVVTAAVGAEVAGELEFHDTDGNDASDTDLGANFLVGLDFRVSF